MMPHSIGIAMNRGFKNCTCHAAISEGWMPGKTGGGQSGFGMGFALLPHFRFRKAPFALHHPSASCRSAPLRSFAAPNPAVESLSLYFLYGGLPLVWKL